MISNGIYYRFCSLDTLLLGDFNARTDFLCHCTLYKVPRKTLYDKLNKKIKADISVLPVKEIAALILNPDTLSCNQDTALFIYSCLNKRKEMIL